MKNIYTLCIVIICISVHITTSLSAQRLVYTSQTGGSYNTGSLEQYFLSDGASSSLFSFKGIPLGGLHGQAISNDDANAFMRGSDGYIYGTSSLMDNYEPGGVFYRFHPDTTSKIEILHVFNFNMFVNTLNPSIYLQNDLYYPVQNVVETSPGVFYGLASAGGSAGYGGVWKYNLNTKTYQVIGSFNDTVTGNLIRSNLFTGPGNNLFGLVRNYKGNNQGHLYKVDLAAGTLKYYHDVEPGAGWFVQDPPLGQVSYNSVMNRVYLSENHSISVFGGGVAYFDFATNITYPCIAIEFSQTDILGSYCQGIVQANDGYYYIPTSSAGGLGNGTLLKFNPTGNTLVKVHDFQHPPNGQVLIANGTKIFGCYNFSNTAYWSYDVSTGMFQDYFTLTAPINRVQYGFFIHDNYIWGETLDFGDINQNGYFFKHGTGTNLNTPIMQKGSTAGRFPLGELTLINNNRLVAIVYNDGKKPTGYNPSGTIVQYDLNTGQLTDSINLNYGVNVPSTLFSKLCLAGNGKLYCLINTKSQAGVSHGGYLLSEVDFENDAIITKKKLGYGIIPNTYGDDEAGNLLEYQPGKLISVIRDSLFIYNINTEELSFITTPFYFQGPYGKPFGNLVKPGNGKMYGLTHTSENVSDTSRIYSIDSTTLNIVNEYTFPKEVKRCNIGLTAHNGKLYGSTSSGGTNGTGYIFSFDLVTKMVSILYSFNPGSDGLEFYAAWSREGNKLYSTSYRGGNFGYGTLAAFDLSNNQFSVLKHLTVKNGLALFATPLILPDDPNVPMNMTLQNNTVPFGQITCFNATHDIVTGGNGTNFNVQQGGRVTMIAGHAIHFLPTTTVHSGAYLHGYIAPGGPYCQTQFIPSALQISEEQSSSDEIASSVDISSGMDNLNFKIYPNPTSKEVSVLSSAEMMSYKIADLFGKTIEAKAEIHSNQITIDMGNYNDGLFILYVVFEDGSYEVQKIVKSRIN